MSNKLVAVCPACPITFTAKHRQQIREMLDDHLVAHYAVLEDVRKDKEAIAKVKELHKVTAIDDEEHGAECLNGTNFSHDECFPLETPYTDDCKVVQGDYCELCHEPFPCDTVKALTGEANE